MSVTRINEFQAQENKGDALRDLIASFVPLILETDGCLSCRLLQNQDDPTRLAVVEEWESVEAHQGAAKTIPPGVMEQAMSLFAGPPKGAYYRAVSS